MRIRMLFSKPSAGGTGSGFFAGAFGSSGNFKYPGDPDRLRPSGSSGRFPRDTSARLFLFNKRMLLLLLLSLLFLQFFSAAYYVYRVSALEEQLAEYRLYHASLQEEKSYLQQEIFEHQEIILELEEELEEATGNEGGSGEGNHLEEGKVEGRLGEGIPGPGSGEEDRVAYLTFDDGPSPNTPEILAVLREYDVPATFFVNGDDSFYGRRMYRRILEEGHVLGNHTYSHDYFSIYRDADSFMEDHRHLEELIYGATGTRPRVTRFPGGSNNTVSFSAAGYDVMEEITAKVEEEGNSYFDWNVYGLDGNKPTPSPGKIAGAVLNKARWLEDRAIILLHDNKFNHDTVKALPLIIEGLEEEGYEFGLLTPQSPPYHFR